MNYKLTALLTCIFIGAFSVVGMYSLMHSKTEEAKEQYSKYLTMATTDAMQNKTVSQGYIFDTEEKRKKTIEIFYRSLANSMNILPSVAKRDLSVYIPCIALIDTDGMYMVYSEWHVNRDGDTVKEEIVSPLYTFSEKYNRFLVRYFLSDTILVENISTGERIQGNYKIVYEELSRPSDLDFLATKDDFNDFKNACIINTVNEKVNFYINEHNDAFRNRYNLTYNMNMPQVKNEDWARLLENPTIISFMQGLQMPHYRNILNIYALCGSEVSKTEEYYASQTGGYLLYHKEDCNKLVRNAIIVSGSMRELASKGYEPCFDCID